jgi:hypothetical protein
MPAPPGRRRRVQPVRRPTARRRPAPATVCVLLFLQSPAAAGLSAGRFSAGAQRAAAWSSPEGQCSICMPGAGRRKPRAVRSGPARAAGRARRLLIEPAPFPADRFSPRPRHVIALLGGGPGGADQHPGRGRRAHERPGGGPDAGTQGQKQRCRRPGAELPQSGERSARRRRPHAGPGRCVARTGQHPVAA